MCKTSNLTKGDTGMKRLIIYENKFTFDEFKDRFFKKLSNSSKMIFIKFKSVNNFNELFKGFLMATFKTLFLGVEHNVFLWARNWVYLRKNFVPMRE